MKDVIDDIIIWINCGSIILILHLDHKSGFMALKTVFAICLFICSLYYISNFLYQVKRGNSIRLHPLAIVGNVIFAALAIHEIWISLTIAIPASILIILINLELIYLKIKYEKERSIIRKWSGLIFMSLFSVAALYEILIRSGYW